MNNRFLSSTVGVLSLSLVAFAVPTAAIAAVSSSGLDPAGKEITATVANLDSEPMLIAQASFYLLVEDIDDYSDEELEELLDEGIIVVEEGELTNDEIERYEEQGVLLYEDDVYEDCET